MASRTVKIGFAYNPVTGAQLYRKILLHFPRLIAMYELDQDPKEVCQLKYKHIFV